MLLKETASSAKISWCPVSTKNKSNLLALGGCGLNPSLNISFFDVTNNGKEIPNICSSSLNSRCTSIAWGNFGSENDCLGLICTGLEDGNLSFFKPIVNRYDNMKENNSLLLENLGDSKIHPSTINCLEFNKTEHNLLASGGNDGKLFVIDLNDGVSGNLNYFEPGKENKHSDSDITALKWNPKVPHIMSSSSSNGNTAIWDLKLKKSAISFRDPAQRCRPSTLAWVPNQPTQIVVGYDDDRNPSLQLWDLRNVSYPFKEAVSAHQKGIMSIDFSPIDSNLLLSSGKDGKTICWTVLSNQQPEIFSEILSQQWNVQNQWSPNVPGIFATASHNDKISIYSLSSHSSTTTYIPCWYNRPSGVNFTFSGKLVSFSNNNSSNTPQFNLYRVPSNPEIIAHADMFDQLLNQGDFIGYCQRKCQESESSNEKLAWNLVENMFSEDNYERRIYIASLLGFDFNNINSIASQFLGRKTGVISQEFQKDISNNQIDQSIIQDSKSFLFSGMSSQNSPNNNNFNNNTSGQISSSQSLDPEKFFQQLGESDTNNEINNQLELENNQEDLFKKHNPIDSNDIYNINNSFSDFMDKNNIYCHINDFPQSNSSGTRLNSIRQREWTKQEEDIINNLLVTGNIDSAIDVCVQRGFFAEAFIMAVKFGGIYLDYVQKQYLKKHEYYYTQKILAHVILDDLEDFVKNSNLDRWNETLAIISIYTQPGGIQIGNLSSQSKYSMENLSELLGKRLQEEKFDVRSALVCYLCARNFRNSIEIWGNMTSCQSSLILGLQDFVEKVAILQAATRFNGNDENITKQVVQYAEILANSGRIVAAMKFLSTLASNDFSINSSTLRDRIYNAAPELMNSLGFNKPNFPFTLIEIVPYGNNIQIHQQYQQSINQNNNNKQLFTHNNHFQSNINPYQMINNGVNQMPPPPQNNQLRPLSNNLNNQPILMNNIPQQQSTHIPLQHNVSTINSNILFNNQTQTHSSFSTGLRSTIQSTLPPPPPPSSINPSHIRPSSSIPSSNIINNSLPPPPSNNILTRPSSPMTYNQNNPGVNINNPLSSINQPSNSFTKNLNSGHFINNNQNNNNQNNNISSIQNLTSNIASSHNSNNINNNFIPSNPNIINNPNVPQINSNRTSITTAPHSGATPPIPGMPVPWPLPTATQQLNSTTSTTANANKQIQEASKKNIKQFSNQPLSPQLLDLVTNVINSNLNNIFSNEPRKKVDAQKRLNELFEKLRTGNISENVSSKVVKLCQSLQTGDYLTANKIHIDLSSTEWDNNKNWLMALKRIIPK